MIQLRSLILKNTYITDASIQFIFSKPNHIKRLDVAFTHCTDFTAILLSQQPNTLEFISLDGCHVSNDSAPFLVSLNDLRVVKARSTLLYNKDIFQAHGIRLLPGRPYIPPEEEDSQMQIQPINGVFQDHNNEFHSDEEIEEDFQEVEVDVDLDFSE